MPRPKRIPCPKLSSRSHGTPLGLPHIVQPTTKMYQPNAGRKLRVIPSQSKPPRHYCIPLASPALAPIFFRDFLVVPEVNEMELGRLERALGRSLNKDAQQRITIANHHLICVAALNTRIPHWSEFRNLLETIKSAATRFNALCSPETEPDPNRGSFTVEQAIALYLMLKMPVGQMRSTVDAVAQIATACDEALESVVKRTSKRGNPGLKDLKAYCKQLVVAAGKSGVSATLDSNETRRETPFVRFVREALKIVCEKADVALDASPLNDEERNNAKRLIAEYASKPPSALVSHIRDARNKLKSRARAPNSPNSKPN